MGSSVLLNVEFLGVNFDLVWLHYGYRTPREKQQKIVGLTTLMACFMKKLLKYMFYVSLIFNIHFYF